MITIVCKLMVTPSSTDSIELSLRLVTKTLFSTSKLQLQHIVWDTVIMTASACRFLPYQLEINCAQHHGIDIESRPALQVCWLHLSPWSRLKIILSSTAHQLHSALIIANKRDYIILTQLRFVLVANLLITDISFLWPRRNI